MNPRESLHLLLAKNPPDYVCAAALEAAEKAMSVPAPGEKTYYKLEQGIAVLRNGGSPYWWISVSLGVKGAAPRRESLKERDLSKAIAKAEYVAERIRQDFAEGRFAPRVRGHLWRAVCEEVVKQLEDKEKLEKAAGKLKPQSTTYISQFKKYIIDLWPTKQISDIGYPELAEWGESTDFPIMSKTWAQNHTNALKQVFEYAVRKRIIVESQVPTIPKFKTKEGEEGIPFEDDDRDLLLGNFTGFIESGRKYETRFLRVQFPFFFQLLCASGLRPGEEVIGLRWRDLREESFEYSGEKKKAFTVTVRFGKMAKEKNNRRSKKRESRTILINANCVDALERLYYVQTGQERNIRDIIKENRDSSIFIGIEGKKPDFGAVFKQYKEYVEKIKPLQEYYVLYSTRHEYINAELDRGVDVQDVADQCGNSPATIHRYYKKYRAKKRAARILTQDDILHFNPPEKKSKSSSKPSDSTLLSSVQK